MNRHMTATRDEWLAARLELLKAEKALTRRNDELARQRQALPWVRVDKDYRFDTEQGSAALADLFQGRSQLLVYHFMFGRDYKAGCPSCSAIADGFNGIVVHLAHHDVTLMTVSRAPLATLQAYRQRMAWMDCGICISGWIAHPWVGMKPGPGGGGMMNMETIEPVAEMVECAAAFASKPAPTVDLRRRKNPCTTVIKMWERACSRRGHSLQPKSQLKDSAYQARILHLLADS